MGLSKIRKKIDSVDSAIIKLISKRMIYAKEIKEYKKKNMIKIYDPKREQEIIKKARADAKKQKLDPSLAEKVMKVLLRNSRKIQKGK